jgi:hypothetical protein
VVPEFHRLGDDRRIQCMPFLCGIRKILPQGTKLVITLQCSPYVHLSHDNSEDGVSRGTALARSP